MKKYFGTLNHVKKEAGNNCISSHLIRVKSQLNGCLGQIRILKTFLSAP